MAIRKALSRERIVNGLKSFGKLRIKISHGSIMTFSALLLILFVAFTIRMLPLRWEIQTGTQAVTLHLSEFDPYYYYSLTNYMVKNGLISPYWPNQWVDKQRWYPDGINMAMSLPGLPMTTALLYDIISVLGVNIDLMSFVAIWPAIAGTLACLIIYFLGKDFGGATVGLFAALFLALSPAYIQRTSLGFADDETVGILALLLFVFLFLRSIDEERPVGSNAKYALGSGLALAYFISGWGAAYYPIGLTALFVFLLILLKRYSQRVLLSYSLTFGLGLFIAINVPYLSTRYLTASVVLPVAGLFVLLCICEILRGLRSAKAKVVFVVLVLALLVGGFFFLSELGYMGSVAGKFLSVIDPFARAGSPLVESVAEHRISAWGSVYYDLGIGIVFFLVGFYFLFRNLNNRNLFLLLFGITTLYFASSMVRLLVLMAPAFSLLASVGIVGVLKPFTTLLREPPKIITKKRYALEHVGKEFSGTAVLLIFIVLMTNFAFSPQSGGIPKVYSQAYVPITITAGSIPIAPNKPVAEWLDMLQYLNNLPQSSKVVVCSWWDYGYWLTMLGNVTSLADNATINGTQIENIGFIFMANETNALKMLKVYDAKYILVFTTLYSQVSNSVEYASWAGYGDEGKWMWMARISGKAQSRFVEGDTNGDGVVDIPNLIDATSSWSNETSFGAYDSNNNWKWNDAGTNSTIYKLMTWGKQRWCNENSATPNEAGVEPQYFKEAYFAGLNLSPTDARANYGGIVPLVCLYEIEYRS
jgi:dolichyl-diphosphooligosaccharide--protein glycosyltransferase